MYGSKSIPVKITHEEVTSTHDLFQHVQDLLEHLGGRLFMDGDSDKAEQCKQARKVMNDPRVTLQVGCVRHPKKRDPNCAECGF